MCVHAFPACSMDSGFGISYSLNDVGSKCRDSVLSTTTRTALGQPTLLLHSSWHSFPGVHELWHEVDHPPPSNAKVKNELNYEYTSLDPICFQEKG